MVFFPRVQRTRHIPRWVDYRRASGVSENRHLRKLGGEGGSIFWQENGLVFPTTTGTTMSGTNLLGRYFKPLLKRAGLPPIRLHDLRHTCATILLMAGKHPK